MKLSLKLIFGVSMAISVLSCNTLLGATTAVAKKTTQATISKHSFDKSLTTLSKQFREKDYQTVVTRLSALSPSEELADLYLYLKAESLKNLKRNDEAIKVYEEITSKYPETEIGKQCFMPLFLLKLEKIGNDETYPLEQFAKSLPSGWQAGRALEKLHNFPNILPNKKSRYALQALRQYSRGTLFYSNAPATHDLLKTIWANADNYEYLDIEWFEILKLTCKEKMLDEVFKKGGFVSPAITNRVDQTTLRLFYACWLCSKKDYRDGMMVLNEIINNTGILQDIRAYALQQRADTYHLNNRHEEAVTDYDVLLTLKSDQIDKLGIEYKRMRSLFYLKRDQECISALNSLIRGRKIGGLLSTQIYDMGLECYDKKEFKRSIPYFKIYETYFIGHHRADDAIGYAIRAAGGIKTAEGLELYKRLKRFYTNSFYLYWLDPANRKAKVKYTDVPLGKVTASQQKQLNRYKKLWNTDFYNFVKAEANILSDKYPRDFTLFKALIDLAAEFDDYKQVCCYGERLARQLLEAGKSLDEMPKWAWEAMYPRPWNDLLKANAKKFDLEIEWIRAIMREESHFDPAIKSRSNAISLMQILPSTGKWIAGKLGEKKFKESMLWDKEVNIRYGSWYLRYLFDMFEREKILATAAYNGGQGNILRKVEAIYPKMPVWERIDKVPMTETRDYFKKVGASYFMYKRLY